MLIVKQDILEIINFYDQEKVIIQNILLCSRQQHQNLLVDKKIYGKLTS